MYRLVQIGEKKEKKKTRFRNNYYLNLRDFLDGHVVGPFRLLNWKR